MVEKVLVTGATGFTGSNLCVKLLAKGYDVRAFVRKSTKYQELEAKGCEICFGDLATGEGINEAVRGVEKVYHIGAAFRVEGVPHKYFWDVNVEGTRELLESSLRNGVKRFIHCSTVGVQGEIKNPPATEIAPYNPGDHYQESKLAGEKLALSYVEKGLYVVVFRPTGIYGPGDTRFLKFFRPIAKGKFILIGNGANLYHLTYIDDLVNGIILCGEVNGIKGEIFTLGGEGYTTVKEIGITIAKVLGKPLKIYNIPPAPVWIVAVLCEIICPILKLKPPLYRRRLDFYLKDRAFDISKAKRLLNYKPTISLEEGLKKTAQWYIAQELII
jgi:nucleoside-diphosphate-sugar epimerase